MKVRQKDSNAVIDVEDLELTPTEAESTSEYVFERVVAKGDLNKLHAIITGIQHGKKIPFVGPLGLVGECIDGCNIPEGAKLKFSEKKWDPQLMGFRLENCFRDVPALMTLLKKKVQKLIDNYDFSGSQEEAIVMLRTEEAVEEMLWRFTQFGDRNIAHQEDGGTLIDSVALKYFNCIDGLWKQIFSNYGPAINGGKRFVHIAANDGADYDAQELADDAAYDLLKAMRKKADSRLKRDKNGAIYFTRSLVENLLDTFEAKSLLNTTDARALLKDQSKEDGNTFLITNWRGVDIYCVDYWDTAITSYFDNGTKYDKPHRALYTTPDNQPIGTPSQEMLGSVDSFFDRDKKVNKIDAEAEFDVVVLEDYMVVAAY